MLCSDPLVCRHNRPPDSSEQKYRNESWTPPFLLHGAELLGCADTSYEYDFSKRRWADQKIGRGRHGK
jgi:hypothetical protein